MSSDANSEAIALLGEAVILMLQSGDADCEEFARGIPVEFKTLDGAPRAALQSRPSAPLLPDTANGDVVRAAKELRAAIEATEDHTQWFGKIGALFTALDAAAPLPAAAERSEQPNAVYPDTEADGVVFCGKCGHQR